MIELLRFVLAILVSPFRSKARLEAEIATPRQQLIVLQRKSRGRVRLTNGDVCSSSSGAWCRSCGKTRELSGDELYGATSMDAFKELERRLRCTDCEEQAVSVEPIFHSDWRG